jgi:hypothetical protein
MLQNLCIRTNVNIILWMTTVNIQGKFCGGQSLSYKVHISMVLTSNFKNAHSSILVTPRALACFVSRPHWEIQVSTRHYFVESSACYEKNSFLTFWQTKHCANKIPKNTYCNPPKNTPSTTVRHKNSLNLTNMRHNMRQLSTNIISCCKNESGCQISHTHAYIRGTSTYMQFF